MAITKDSENLYSSMRFVGDGVTKRVPLTFDLREGDGLAVDFGKGLVTEGYLIDHDVTPVVVLFSDPLPLGKTITIRRLTKIDMVKHVFQYTGNAQGGADFSAKNVDENFEQITRSSQDAMDSQTLATETLEGMAGIRDDALKYRNEAEEFRNEAEVLRDSTVVKAEEASISAGKAKTSEVNAKTSETNAKESEVNASASASSALASATTATQEATKAGTYASNAKTSETNSKTSETNSKTSETNANSSASKAKTSETNAKTSETNANASATRASTSEVNAKTSETNAKHSEEEAKRWAEEAQESVLGDILVEGEGNSTTKAMTQKSVTDALNKKWDIQDTTGTGNIARMSEVEKKRDINNHVFDKVIKITSDNNSPGLLLESNTEVVLLEKAEGGGAVYFALRRRSDDSNIAVVSLPRKTGTLALTSDIPTAPDIDYGRTCALGAEQQTVAGAGDNHGTSLKSAMLAVPASCIVTKVYDAGGVRVKAGYRPIIRTGW